jgi:hypothetical protein
LSCSGKSIVDLAGVQHCGLAVLSLVVPKMVVEKADLLLNCVFVFPGWGVLAETFLNWSLE